MIGLTATLAPTIGPTLGGWLTETFSWHWLFLINVPFGIVVAVRSGRGCTSTRPNLAMRHGFDWLGLGLMALFLGNRGVCAGGRRALELVRGRDDRPLHGDRLRRRRAVLLAHAGPQDPLVDLRTFRNGNFSIGCLFSFVLGTGMYGTVYMIPLFLGRVRGYDSLQIGETMFVTGFGMFACSAAGWFPDQKGRRSGDHRDRPVADRSSDLVDRTSDQGLGVLGVARAASAARLRDDVRDDRIEPDGTGPAAADDDEERCRAV